MNIINTFLEVRKSTGLKTTDVAKELSEATGRKIDTARIYKWRGGTEPTPSYIYTYMLKILCLGPLKALPGESVYKYIKVPGRRK